MAAALSGGGEGRANRQAAGTGAAAANADAIAAAERAMEQLLVCFAYVAGLWQIC